VRTHHLPRTVVATPHCRTDTAPAQPGSDSPLTVLTKAGHCEKTVKQRSSGGGAAQWMRASVRSVGVPRQPAAGRAPRPLGGASSWRPCCPRVRARVVASGVELSAHHLAHRPRGSRSRVRPPPAFHAACCVGRIRWT